MLSQKPIVHSNISLSLVLCFNHCNYHISIIVVGIIIIIIVVIKIFVFKIVVFSVLAKIFGAVVAVLVAFYTVFTSIVSVYLPH